MFVSDTYCLLDFDVEELEDNFTNGVHNHTGYEIEVSKLQSGKIKSLSDVSWYYVLLRADLSRGNFAFQYGFERQRGVNPSWLQNSTV